LAKAVGQDITLEELVSAFVNLLKDNEAEVRTAAANQISGIDLDFNFVHG
jgi:serine/threonine-protein phosphatase 2A regulatory subunit A